MDADLALSVPRAAKAAGISRSYLWELIAAGEGPLVVRIGKRAVIRRDALDDWLKQREGIWKPSGDAATQ